MSDGLVGTKGTKLYIGTKAATLSTDTYTQVAMVENYSDFGKMYETVKFVPVEDGRTRKIKGPYDQGTLQLTLGAVPADAGQDKLLDAQDDPDSYNFKIELNDAPRDSDGDIVGTPTKIYFKAKVMGYRRQGANASGVWKASCPLEIDSDIDIVPAAASS